MHGHVLETGQTECWSMGGVRCGGAGAGRSGVVGAPVADWSVETAVCLRREIAGYGGFWGTVERSCPVGLDAAEIACVAAWTCGRLFTSVAGAGGWRASLRVAIESDGSC